MELLLGCGNSRDKRIVPGWRPVQWDRLVTLDIDPNCGADVLADINDGLPFAADTFDEIHAYDVLEHLGSQGDYRAFFRHFGEIYRVLKPLGILVASTPRWDSVWAWGDPGHCRVIAPQTLQFLDQNHYRAEVGKTSSTDYRWLWKGDLKLVWRQDTDDHHAWILQKHPLAV